MICLVSAVVGAILYICLNRWVEGMEGGEEESAPSTQRTLTQDVEAPPETAPLVESTTTPRTEKRTAAQRWHHVKTAVKLSKIRFEVQLRHGTAKGQGDAQSLALGMLAGIVADGIP